MKRITLALVIFSLTACAGTSVKTKSTTAKAKRVPSVIDYSAIKPTNYKALATNYINKYIRVRMKDPSSMKITNILEPKKEVCRDGKGKKFRIWSVLAGINSKNSYGAYTGAKPYKVFFKNGKPVDYAYDLLIGTEHSLPYCSAISLK